MFGDADRKKIKAGKWDSDDEEAEQNLKKYDASAYGGATKEQCAVVGPSFTDSSEEEMVEEEEGEDKPATPPPAPKKKKKVVRRKKVVKRAPAAE